MDRASSVRRRPGTRRALVAALVLPLLLASCDDPGPTPTPVPAANPAPTLTPAPVIELPIPEDDTAVTQVLLRSADGTYDLYASVGQLQGASSTCTAVLLDTGGSPTVPAYAITNGHCVGIFGANELILDRAVEGMAVAFDWFIDRPEPRVVPVTRVLWGSTRTTDLAVLELAATRDGLRDVGVQGWRPAMIQGGAGTSIEVVMLGVPVGAPLVDIPEAERFLRLGTCILDVDPVVLNERQWLWPDSRRNDCPEVLPGNSGSAVLDRATGGLVGLINTTTYKGEQGAECWLGRPCEVNEDGEASLPDTSYAQPVGGLGSCFAADGDFALGGACPLEAGGGVISLDGAPLAVNPSAADPLTGEPSRTSWGTTVVTASPTTYRYKIGPLYGTDCADESGYSAPIETSIPIDDELPLDEQRLLMCAVAEGSPLADAAIAVAYIDTTAPVADITFAVSGSKAEGWRVEPVFNPPELSMYIVKVGPARTTSCADREGYTVYRRIPVNVASAEAPARFCAIGYDDASNPSEPAFQVLR